MTSDREIMHVVAGYISPAEFLVEMEYAYELFEKLKEESGNRFDLVRTSHQDKELRSRLANRAARIETEYPSLREQKSKLPSRMTGGSGSPGQLIARDDQYMIQRPLITMDEFRKNPGELVGNGRTFFSSTTNASQSVRR